MKVGLVVKPKTEINEHILSMVDKGLIDNFLIMTVGNFKFYLIPPPPS